MAHITTWEEDYKGNNTSPSLQSPLANSWSPSCMYSATIYCTREFRFSRPTAAFTVDCRLVGRKVMNEDNVFKHYDNLLTMVLTDLHITLQAGSHYLIIFFEKKTVISETCCTTFAWVMFQCLNFIISSSFLILCPLTSAHSNSYCQIWQN
jgi:hypothetical protein